MSENDLRQTTLLGMTWTFAKTLSLQLFGLIQGIILARLLEPTDYGLIAMTQIFFAVSAVFIDSGFTSALIKKQDRTELDYSTVFVANIFLTAFFALLLVIVAPYIAQFYREPLLIKIIRANAILLILNSLNATQGTRMSINLQFKEKSIINVVVNVSVGIASIICALCGFGVWSLIYPNYLAPFLYLALFWHFQHWRPRLNFSWQIWKSYFSFGSKILVSSLINQVFLNIYPLIIGKAFSSKDLGFYNKANDYAKLPAVTVQGVIQQVTYPVLSSIQNDESRLSSTYRRLIRMSGFLVFPLMFGLSSLAEPIIILLITDKWASSIPLLRVLCFAFIFYPVQALNTNVLYLKGRTDIALRIEIITKLFLLLFLFITVPLGIFWMCVGYVVYHCICLLINMYFSGRLISLGIAKQLSDLAPSFILSMAMGIVIAIISRFFSSYFLELFLCITVGLVIYLGGAYLFRIPELEYSIDMIKSLLRRR